MKYGYSLFLQEYVNPKDVDYEDTRLFQIICPECKEPVFKVSREKTYNYFSHYKKDETLIKQCELRVNSISSSKINEVSVQSRNQKLSEFLKVFQDLIWNDDTRQNDIPEIKKHYYMLQRSSIFSEIRIDLLKYGKVAVKDKNYMLEMFDEVIEDKFNKAEIYNSVFALNIQKEYAFDFMNHLVAGHSKTNFLFLLSIAFIELYYDLKRKTGELQEWEELLLSGFTRFFRTRNDKKRTKIFQDLASQEIISQDTGLPMDGYLLFSVKLFEYAFGILLRIPYLEILQKRLTEKEK